MTATEAIAVRDRPILMSGPMVRATLEDRKTQTRRAMEHQPYSNTIGWRRPGDPSSDLLCYNDYLPPSATLLDVGRGRNRYTTPLEEEGGSFVRLCPYGQPGDRLWVRETLYLPDTGTTWRYSADDVAIELDEDDPRVPAMVSWAHHKATESCPSIHMPRWASRLTLEITNVRVERLGDMPWQDAVAEGVDVVSCDHSNAEYGACTDCMNTGIGEDPRYAFASLWDSLNAKRGYSWESNPWVWVIEFRRAES